MILQWFDASEASNIGAALADQYAIPQIVDSSIESRELPVAGPRDELAEIFQRVDREIRDLRLNFYKRARLANAFKWRLLEKGVERRVADDATQRLVMRLSLDTPSIATDETISTPDRSPSKVVKDLVTRGNQCMARGAYAEAIDTYQELLKITPRHPVALNNLGAALYKLGRVKEAEGCLHQAIKIQPDYPDAYSNIGNALLLGGQYAAAESYLRHAIKLNPRLVQARVNLGLVLSFLSRPRDARSQFEKALKYEPRNADALCGLAVIEMTRGDFDQTGALLSRALQINPRMPKALSLQAGLRKMTPSDDAWLKSAEEVAESGLVPLDESELRFAIAKYYDDVGDYKRAFQNYKRANDLLRSIAAPYDREAYRNFVDTMIRSYTQDSVARVTSGGSASTKPVFVVGMPRSGTSLVEQIISSHPSARGAGELEFWDDAMREHEARIKEGTLDESKRGKLAEAYLRVLQTKSGDSMRAVDKAPVNSDYLGVIHSVFPGARIIYMDRDPIDTCLSCYFQKFVLSLNFTMDLSDLAEYYRQHQRLMSHWRAVLPRETMLIVPYEELVADQELWSRKILEFLGLEWDQQVLNFHETKREVATASFWQVRQKIYRNSVQRWRNYAKFIGPLGDLKGSVQPLDR